MLRAGEALRAATEPPPGLVIFLHLRVPTLAAEGSNCDFFAPRSKRSAARDPKDAPRVPE